MEKNPVDSPEKLSPDFFRDTRFGRFLTLAITFQLAILCATLIINFATYNGLSADLDSISPRLVYAAMMAVPEPLAWFYFLYGLSYALDVYLIPGNPGQVTAFAASPLFVSNLAFYLPYLTYAGIVLPAILTHKRLVFFILYAIFVVVLIVNIAGCAVMPKPNRL